MAILYGGLTSPATARDARPARAALSALKGAGMTAWITPVRRPIERLVRTLRRRRPDVAVPLVPFEVGAPGTPAMLATLLEWLELPYVGSQPAALAVAEDDFLRGAVLEASGLGRGDLGDAIEVGVMGAGEAARVCCGVDLDPEASAMALAAFESLGLRDLATIRVQHDASRGWGVAGVSPVLTSGVPPESWVELVREALRRSAETPE